jgi:hypothetical protein
MDGLTNFQELQLGTLPCRADTDGGGENDGSEVRNRRNPLDPTDDRVRPLGKIRVRPLNRSLMIDWSYTISYTNMIGYISTNINELGRQFDMGQKGDFLVTGLTNGDIYFVRLQGVNDNALGDLSDPIAVMPKADPDMPSGVVLIENGRQSIGSREVTLHVSATDRPLEGAAQGSAAHQSDVYSMVFNEISGNIQMRFSNTQDMSGAAWEPFAVTKAWTLDCEPGELCTVYAQFKDGAENESLIVYDTIVLETPTFSSQLFLPVVTR